MCVCVYRCVSVGVRVCADVCMRESVCIEVCDGEEEVEEGRSN